MEKNDNMNNQVNESNNVQEEKKNNNKTIGIVVLIISLLLVSVAVYKLFIEKPDTDKPKDNNTQDSDNNNNTVVSDEQIYKTKDGKYTFKLLNNGKAYINDKEVIVLDKEEDNRYIEIEGDFDPSPGFIAGLGFVLDKETKTIVESPYYDETDKSSECGFESYGEYGRFCTRCYGFDVFNIYGWDFFERGNELGASGIYTTDWKELGYAYVDKIKFDNDGIYVCNDYFESTCESGETKYDVNGNVVDN